MKHIYFTFLFFFSVTMAPLAQNKVSIGLSLQAHEAFERNPQMLYYTVGLTSVDATIRYNTAGFSLDFGWPIAKRHLFLVRSQTIFSWHRFLDMNMMWTGGFHNQRGNYTLWHASTGLQVQWQTYLRSNREGPYASVGLGVQKQIGSRATVSFTEQRTQEIGTQLIRHPDLHVGPSLGIGFKFSGGFFLEPTYELHLKEIPSHNGFIGVQYFRSVVGIRLGVRS